jgi:hypothetical protein
MSFLLPRSGQSSYFSFSGFHVDNLAPPLGFLAARRSQRGYAATKGKEILTTK